MFLNKFKIYFMMIIGTILILLPYRMVAAQSLVPDLLIKEITFSSENPQDGEQMTITVVINNIGQASAEQIPVLFSLDDEEKPIGGMLINTLMDNPIFGRSRKLRLSSTLPQSVNKIFIMRAVRA